MTLTKNTGRDHVGRCNPNYKHGFAGTRIYRLWARLENRRGKVCKSWKCFEAFHLDMGDMPVDGHLIRIDENLPWSKENCAWTTRKWRHH